MKINLLDTRSTQRSVQNAIKKHSEIWIASAWASDFKTSQLLIDNHKKVKFAIFGVSGFFTSPTFIRKIVGLTNFLITESTSGIFHPKIYLFSSADTAELIIGSSNFTEGGLSRNTELCTHISGNIKEAIFEKARDVISEYATTGISVTKEFSDSYRLEFDALRIKKMPSPTMPQDRKKFVQTQSNIANLSWADFAEQAKQDPYHDYDQRLALLRRAQEIFTRSPSFSDMSTSERKAISGVIGESEQELFSPGLNWAWFGTMRGSGEFAKLVGENNRALSEAIDSIPLRGPISEMDYQNYLSLFKKAFLKATRKGGIATATRLIAMKRPDIFVAVNGKNKKSLAIQLGIPQSTLNELNYWKNVIETVQISKWFNNERPKGRDRELWDFRAAMLDTIVYEE